MTDYILEKLDTRPPEFHNIGSAGAYLANPSVFIQPDTDFITVVMAYGETSFDRPIRSSHFAQCTGYLLIGIPSDQSEPTPTLMLHIFAGTSSIEDNNQGLRADRINPFFDKIRDMGAETVLLPIFGINADDKRHLLTNDSDLGGRIDRVLDAVIVPGNSRWWGAAYRPQTKELILHNQSEDTFFRLNLAPYLEPKIGLTAPTFEAARPRIGEANL